MDPNETLTHLIAWAVSTVNDENESEWNREAAQHLIDLNGWLERGGFLPQGWKRS